MTKSQSLYEAEHEARCDLIDVMDMLGVAVTHGSLTAAEVQVYGEHLERLRAKYPQQKAPRAPDEPTAGRPIYIDRAEAEFIDDACIKDGAPQWHELQDQVRDKFGMTPVNRPTETEALRLGETYTVPALALPCGCSFWTNALGQSGRRFCEKHFADLRRSAHETTSVPSPAPPLDTTMTWEELP